MSHLPTGRCPRSHAPGAAGRTLLALVAGAALWLGCNRPKEDGPPAAVPGHPLANDGSVARGVTTTLDRVRVETDLVSVRNAVRIFQAEHEGKLPSSLEECGVQGLHYPQDYRYDGATGTVKSETYPSL